MHGYPYRGGVVSKERPSVAALKEDKEHLARETSFADTSLTRLGAYVNYERISKRPPSAKTVAETIALVVEDDPDQLALAVLRLNAAGYATQTADSVRSLYHRLQRRAPDAIFLDIGLPDGDGFEVLASLRPPRFSPIRAGGSPRKRRRPTRKSLAPPSRRPTRTPSARAMRAPASV